MQGVPLTRAMSADGRFAYTLYERPTAPPFIHALDTARGTAACIDLPSLAGGNLSGARLAPPAGARPLVVRVRGLAPLAVDVAARRARPVSAERPAAHDATAGGDLRWLVALAATVALGAALVTAARRHLRRRPRVA